MNSQEPKGRSVEGERSLIRNKYVLMIGILLFTAVIINSLYYGGDFSVTTLSGDNFSVSGNRGRVIMINFMTTTCSYCRAETLELKKLWDSYDGKIVLVSISVDPITDTDGLLRDFASSHGADWIWARDVVGAAMKYKVSGTPTTFILDDEGRIRYRHEGFTEAITLMNELDILLNS